MKEEKEQVVEVIEWERRGKRDGGWREKEEERGNEIQ